MYDSLIQMDSFQYVWYIEVIQDCSQKYQWVFFYIQIFQIDRVFLYHKHRLYLFLLWYQQKHDPENPSE